jgi:hypothetical protein
VGILTFLSAVTLLTYFMCFNLAMEDFKIIFCNDEENENISSYGAQLEDEMFATTLNYKPSDRHQYKINLWVNPIR